MKAIHALGVAMTAFVLLSAGANLNVALDCEHVCARYASCIDDSFDVDACRAQCVERAAEDKAYRADVNACDACLEESVCLEVLYDCTRCDDVLVR